MKLCSVCGGGGQLYRENGWGKYRPVPCKACTA